jgi:hypothetical protein
MNIHQAYRPFLVYFRRKRIEAFVRKVRLDSGMSILDVGGDTFFWDLMLPFLGPDPPKITILNIYNAPRNLPQHIRWLKGDGCDMPFETGQFDWAFSNSVIEHLGTKAAQELFAAEVRRVARRYWVQTPNPRFFVEPHYLTPFVHWLPKRLQRVMLRYFSVWGLLARPTRADIEKNLAEIRLIQPREFRTLFPDAEIRMERFAGMPKSLIAIRS